jgi:hypothetical protein
VWGGEYEFIVISFWVSSSLLRFFEVVEVVFSGLVWLLRGARFVLEVGKDGRARGVFLFLYPHHECFALELAIYLGLVPLRSEHPDPRCSS